VLPIAGIRMDYSYVAGKSSRYSLITAVSFHPSYLTCLTWVKWGVYDNNLASCYRHLRIFQRLRLVKFIEKFKTRVKNLIIEKIIAFDKYLYELFFAFYFHLSIKFISYVKKIMKLLIRFTFLQNAAVFKVFINNETVDCRQTFLNCLWNSDLHWKQFFRSSSNLNQTLSILIQQF